MSLPVVNLPNQETIKKSKCEFDNQGFTTLPIIFSVRSVDYLNAEIRALDENYTKGAIYRVVRDDRDNVLVMHNPDKVSDLLFDLARSTALMHLAEIFCDKPVVPLHMEYFSKPALHSSPTPPHQDHAFYREHFDDELAVSFWIALDEVDSARAPLQFVPCREKSLLPHEKSEAKDFEFQLMNLPHDNDYVTVPISKGSCIVHHSFTVHRSAPNQSGLSRRALVFNYRSSDFRLSQNACLQQ